MGKEIIAPITNEEVQKIRNKTPTNLPNRPNQEGFSPQYLKDLMAHALLDNHNSIKALLDKVINSVNDSTQILRVVESIPSTLEDLNNKVVFEKSTNNLYLIDTTQESGKVLIANLDLADVADKDFVYEAIRNAIANKLDYETNTDKRVIIKSSNDEGVALVDTINNNRVDVSPDGISIKGKVTSGIETYQIVSEEEELVLDSKANDFSLRSNKNPDILDYDYDDNILNYNGSEVVNKKYVETLEKQVANLKASAEGNTFNYETDSSVAYEKVVPANASPYASLDKIGGMSYVVVASKNILDFSKLKVDSYNASIDYNNKTITVPSGNTSGQTFNTLKEICPSLNVGDTLYVNAICSNPNAEKRLMVELSGLEIRTYDFNTAITITEEILNDSIAFYNSYDDNSVPNTLSEIMFSKYPISEYEEYREKIRNTKVTAIKSVGANLLHLENQYISNANIKGINMDIFDGVITCTGTSTNYGIEVFNFEKPLKGGVYTLNVYQEGGYSNAYSIGFVMERSNGELVYDLDPIDSNEGVYEIDTDDKVIGIGISVDSGANLTGLILKPMVTKGSYVSDEFKQYFEETKPIPTEIQNIEDYGEGVNNNDYNYLDIDKGVFETISKKVSINIDLIGKPMGTNPSGNKISCGIRLVQTTYPTSGGTETGFYKFSIDNFTLYSLRSSNSINSNMKQTTGIPNYTNYTDYSQLKYEQVAIQNNTFFIVIDKNKASTVEEFKTWLTNNPFEVVYKLNTPIETDVSKYLKGLDNFIKVEPNGPITFENEHEQACGSEVTYEVKL